MNKPQGCWTATLQQPSRGGVSYLNPVRTHVASATNALKGKKGRIRSYVSLTLHISVPAAPYRQNAGSCSPAHEDVRTLISRNEHRKRQTFSGPNRIRCHHFFKIL